MTRSRAAKRAWLAVGATIVVGLLAACSTSGRTSQGAASAGGSASSGPRRRPRPRGAQSSWCRAWQPRRPTPRPPPNAPRDCRRRFGVRPPGQPRGGWQQGLPPRRRLAPGGGINVGDGGVLRCPPPLPADLTINTTAGLDQEGRTWQLSSPACTVTKVSPLSIWWGTRWAASSRAGRSAMWRVRPAA